MAWEIVLAVGGAVAAVVALVVVVAMCTVSTHLAQFHGNQCHLSLSFNFTEEW